MDSPFIYDKYVTGKNFIGRKEDCVILGNLVSHGENIALYAPPKSGKSSIIHQTLFNMRLAGGKFVTGEINLLNVRTINDFLTRFGSTAIRTVASTPDEYGVAVSGFLDGTHFVFDRQRFADTDEIVSLNWDIDEDDIDSMLRLPYRLGQAHSLHIIMIINEFQNLNFTEDGEKIFKAMERVMKENRAVDSPSCSFILCGSQVNAMKDIFEHRRFFYRLVEHFSLSKVDSKIISEHIIKGFLSGGKVVDRELILGVCALFRNNLWYINHFTSICDSLSKGYITEPMLMEALDMLLSIHEPHFLSIMNDLTTFQVSLLKAIIDGKTRFSSSDVIKEYSLNSSANVRRLKDALMKKEIVTFNENDEPQIIDPLFEYWARKYYFEIKD